MKEILPTIPFEPSKAVTDAGLFLHLGFGRRAGGGSISWGVCASPCQDPKGSGELSTRSRMPRRIIGVGVEDSLQAHWCDGLAMAGPSEFRKEPAMKVLVKGLFCSP